MPEERNTHPFPTSADSLPGTEIPEEVFDISQFDFTIADPGEDPPSPSPAPQPSPREELRVEPEEPQPVPPAAPRRKVSFRLPQRSEEGEQRKTLLLMKGRRWLRYALRPASMTENLVEEIWPLSLAGSSLFFGLFYVLVGMDWLRADLISPGRMWILILAGLLVGAVAAMSFAGGAQILSLLARKERLRPFQVLSSVAGAAVFPTVILALGLLIGLLFGASVSMSFGMMAILWWIYTLMEVLKDLFPQRMLPILTFLSLWGFLLFAILSGTFSLK